MFGMTHGAMQVHRNPERYAADKVGVELARHASWFAVTGVGVMIGFLCAPLLVPGQYLGQALSLIVFAFIAPFAQSGVCITLLLTRLPFSGGRMYATDLAGAALGCLGAIFALFFVDPVSATLWVAAFAAAAGWNAARPDADHNPRRLSALIAVLLITAAAAHTGLYLSGRGHIGVLWAKGNSQTDTEFERWNTFSRVRVGPRRLGAPFGWGLSHEPRMTVEQRLLDIDADAGTVITRLDGDPRRMTFLRDDVVNSAYLTEPVHDVAIIGVGGGRDVLSALFFGAEHITGIEMNPAILQVLTEKYADYSGRLDRRPGVTLVQAEARSYLNQSRQRYDLVQVSLIDTWAATAAGGLALTENRIYTVQAWSDFYRVLKPGGLLSVSRWFDPASHRSEFYRLVAIGARALALHGVPPAELPRHVVALNVGQIVTVITRPDAFTQEQWRRARAAYEAQGFKILLGPDIRFDNITTTLLSGRADTAFFDSLPENIAPSTDDNPFFFFNSRFGQLSSRTGSLSPENNGTVRTLLWLLALSLLAYIYYIAVPFPGLVRRRSLSAVAIPVAYFSAIGMGFMLVEVSQMQRLMVFLGHPVFGLGVVLFSLLLFSGVGSATVGRQSPSRAAIAIRLAGLLLALAATGLLTPMVIVWTKADGTLVRIAASVALLAPPAVFMGMMFPLGLDRWRGEPDLLAFFWSANGITSVFASVLGAALSMEIGINMTFAIGAAFYGLCCIMLLGTRLRMSGPISGNLA